MIFCLLDTILPQNWHETLACHKTQLEIMVTSHFSRCETSHCSTCMSLWPIRHGSHFFGIRSLFNPDKAQLATMIIHDIFVPQYLPRFKKLSHPTIDYICCSRGSHNVWDLRCSASLAVIDIYCGPFVSFPPWRLCLKLSE